MGKKLTIEEVKKRAKEIGAWEVLDDVYTNSKIKLFCRCLKCGRTYKINWNFIQQRVKCAYCVGNKNLTIEFVRAAFAKEGYILLTKVYKNSAQKLEYICPEGHKHSIRWDDWKRGQRCPYRAGNVRHTIEFVRAAFAKEGYILLTKIYKNAHQKLEYICPRGHRHSTTWASWNSKRKCRCPFCKDSHVSKWEKTIRKFLDSLHVSYMPNDKTQLTNPKTDHSLELDMWFPQLNKAIECNGVYWHKKKKQNDKIKKQLCKDQNIDLLVITDEEWNKDIDKCKTKIKTFVTGE